MRLPPVNAIVQVAFLDHCEDGDALPCMVWGRLIAKTRQTITVVSWAADGEPHNEKRWTLLRRALTEVIELAPAAGGE
jgi:hypothetical protein